MGTMTLNGGAALTYTSETWATAPATAYSAWCSAIGVSDATTLVAIDDDDVAFPFVLQAPFFTTGAGDVFYSSEAGIGFALATPGDTTSARYDNFPERFYGTQSLPAFVVMYRPGGDLKSQNGKVQKSGSTTLIYAEHSQYNDDAVNRYDCAIKITPQSIEIVGTTTDADSTVRLIECFENNAPNDEYTIRQQATIQLQDLGTTYRYTITTGSSAADPEGIATAPPPLGSAVVLGRATVGGIAAAPSPLGSASVVGISYSLPVGRAAAPGLLGAAGATGIVIIGGVSSAPGVLQAALVLGLHDFTQFVENARTDYYVMDLNTETGAVRVPISSWQATLRTGISNYVQCVIPACFPFTEAIQAATSFSISRRVKATTGDWIEYQMASAPVDTRNFDKGPTRYTCTLSGYSPGFDAGDGDPPAAYDRNLQQIRNTSLSDDNVRVRCAIDWLLRPGHRAIADGIDFVVEYINYYAMNNDSYMDCGGAK